MHAAAWIRACCAWYGVRCVPHGTGPSAVHAPSCTVSATWASQAYAIQVDMDGHKVSWLGIALLPFVDEQRLKAEVSKIRRQCAEHRMNACRRRRRRRRCCRLPLSSLLLASCCEFHQSIAICRRSRDRAENPMQRVRRQRHPHIRHVSYCMLLGCSLLHVIYSYMVATCCIVYIRLQPATRRAAARCVRSRSARSSRRRRALRACLHARPRYAAFVRAHADCGQRRTAALRHRFGARRCAGDRRRLCVAVAAVGFDRGQPRGELRVHDARGQPALVGAAAVGRTAAAAARHGVPHSGCQSGTRGCRFACRCACTRRCARAARSAVNGLCAAAAREPLSDWSGGFKVRAHGVLAAVPCLSAMRRTQRGRRQALRARSTAASKRPSLSFPFLSFPFLSFRPWLLDRFLRRMTAAARTAILAVAFARNGANGQS